MAYVPLEQCYHPACEKRSGNGVQGRSKHLETGPDMNVVKLHPLIN